jgi:hypothetical protein
MSKANDVGGLVVEIVLLLVLAAAGILMGQPFLDPIEAAYQEMTRNRDTEYAGKRFWQFVSRKLCVREEKPIARFDHSCPDRGLYSSVDGTNPAPLLGAKVGNVPANTIDDYSATMYCIQSTTGAVTLTLSKPVAVKLLRVRQTRKDPMKRPTSLMKRMAVSWEGGHGEVLFDVNPMGTGDVTGETQLSQTLTKITLAPAELATTFKNYPVCIAAIELVGRTSPDVVIAPEATALLGIGFGNRQ